MALKGYEEVASVKFLAGTNTTKEYNFASYDHIVQPGDHALVKCASAYTQGAYSVVKVISVTPAAEYAGTAPTAEIICKVDLSAYEKRCAMRKEREVLKKKMDKLVKDTQELVVYQTIAKDNEDMAELLRAYCETLNA